MELLLIRHGEMAGDAFACPARPVKGCLSPRGLAQAQAAREALASARIDHAFSSPYGRALQTCEMVLANRPAPITVLDCLKEWIPDRGLEKIPRTDFEAIQAQTEGLHAEETWKTDLGEGCFDMYARIVPPFLKAIAGLGIRSRLGGYVADGAAANLVVAVFAHGGSLNVLLSFLLNVRPFPIGCFAFELTGVARIRFAERQGIHYPVLTLATPHADSEDRG